MVAPFSLSGKMGIKYKSERKNSIKIDMIASK